MTHGLNHDLNNGLNNSLALYRPTTRTAAVSFCGVKPGESLKQRFKATPFAETVADVLALWLPGQGSSKIPGGTSHEIRADADELLDRLRETLQAMPLTVLSDEDMDAPGTGLVDRLSIERRAAVDPVEAVHRQHRPERRRNRHPPLGVEPICEG